MEKIPKKTAPDFRHSQEEPSAAAGMPPAAVLSASVLRSMVMIVVFTAHVGVIVQLSLEQSLHRLVSLAGHASVQPDARRRQSRRRSMRPPSAR